MSPRYRKSWGVVPTLQKIVGSGPHATENRGEWPGLCSSRPRVKPVTHRTLPPQHGAAGVTDNTSSLRALAFHFVFFYKQSNPEEDTVQIYKEKGHLHLEV